MAVRKRGTKSATKKITKAPAQAMPKNSALLFLVFVIAVLVFGLAAIWRKLPTRPAHIAQQPIAAPLVSQTQQLTCERAGGKWTDCGNPCHGKDDGSCIALCEPQCLCGGAPKYTCPANTVCADKSSDNDAIGVCREQVSEPTQAITNTVITALVDTRSYPFTVKGTVTGTSTAIWWTALDASSEVVGRGAIRWIATSSSSFEEPLFLSAMPTSTALRFTFTAGSLEDKVEVLATSTRLVSMTRTIYKDDPLSEECTALIKEEIALPKTNLPYEATMRAALGDSLIDLSVSQGVATIVTPLSAIYSDNCTAARIKAIAEAITKDFNTVTSINIQELGT